MYLRLAFAVAAHLDSEILVVDEVLAVGDASFQKKCLAKMEDVGHNGRTVMFVSHNMMAVTRLCERTILLDEGRVVADGQIERHRQQLPAIGRGHDGGSRVGQTSVRAPGNEIVRLRAVRVRTEAGDISEAIDIRAAVRVEMEFDVLQAGHALVPNFHFFNEEGTCVFIAGDHDPDWKRRTRPVGRFSTTAWIPGNLLSEGTIVVSAAVSTMDPVTVHFFERDAVAFQVIDSLDGDSARGDYAGPFPGVVRPLLRWTTELRPDRKRTPRNERAFMKVVLLAGGLGTRLAEETEVRPKPMVEIGGRPILWHIMKHFAHYGHNEFYIALGYKGEYIKRYFVDYLSLNGSMSIDMANGKIESRDRDSEDWVIHLVDTGFDTPTGSRVHRLRPMLNGEPVLVTYGDGVGDIDLDALLTFHRGTDKLATVTAVRPPARFGELLFDGDSSRSSPRSRRCTKAGSTADFWCSSPERFDYLHERECSLEVDTPVAALGRPTARRLQASGLLAVHGHSARQASARNALGLLTRAPWKVWT